MEVSTIHSVNVVATVTVVFEQVCQKPFRVRAAEANKRCRTAVTEGHAKAFLNVTFTNDRYWISTPVSAVELVLGGYFIVVCVFVDRRDDTREILPVSFP